MSVMSTLAGKGKGLLGWAGSKARSGMGWYGGLGNTAKYAISGAATGALSGGFGINPFNTVPFFGDVDAGGALGGAMGGALAGAAFGRFGANRNLLSRGRNTLGRGTGRLAMRMGPDSLLGKGALRSNHFLLGNRASSFTNKYGDMVLASMAAGTAGLIGGSILSTNSPY
jgi:hypothetical protein